MKFKKHLDIIKNFSDISPAMVFTSDKIRIINQSNSIFANYEWGEKLPVEKFGIYNVKEFVQIISLFEDPDVEITEKEIYITENNRKSNYFSTDPKLIKYDEREIKEDKLGKPSVGFKLSKQLHKKMKEVIGVIQARHLIFSIDGEELKIMLKDKDNSSASGYEIKIPKGEFAGSFDGEVLFYADDFMLFEGDYLVSIYAKKIFKFEEKEKKLVYFIAIKKS